MEKIYKNFIFIQIVLLWSIELITMNENSNGIISRKIIGRFFNMLSFVYKFLSKYLNYKINKKVVKKLLNIGCSLDNKNACNNYAYLFSPKIRLKYLKKNLELDPNYIDSINNIIYYYIENNNEKEMIKYLNRVKNNEEKRKFKIYAILLSYNLEKMKVYKNDYKTYKNPKNFTQKSLKVYSYLFNGLLNENQSNIIQTKKYYDNFLNNLNNLDNSSRLNPIKIIFKNTFFSTFLITINVSRIYYYGLSSKGKNIKKAKEILSIASEEYHIIKRTKFWKDEYDKINNHKL